MTVLAKDEMDRLKEDGLLVLRQVVDPRVLGQVRQSISDFVDSQIEAMVSAGVVGDPHEEAPFETRWAIVSSEIDLQNSDESTRGALAQA